MKIQYKNDLRNLGNEFQSDIIQSETLSSFDNLGQLVKFLGHFNSIFIFKVFHGS